MDFSKIQRIRLISSVMSFMLGLACAPMGLAMDGFSIEGFSRPNRISRVAAATSGVLTEILVEEGAIVVEGQCLCRLDSAIHDALLKVAAATKDAVGELNAAKAEFRSVQLRYETISELATRQHSSVEELQRAIASFEIATANLQIAEEKQRLRLAEYEKVLAQAQQYQIAAPFDGVVVEFNREKGEYVGPVEAQVCTVAELSTLSVDFLLPRPYRSEIELDSNVLVQFTESNQQVSAKVVYVSPYPDAETATYTVKVQVNNADGSLNAGERCLLIRARNGGTRATPAKPPHFTNTR